MLTNFLKSARDITKNKQKSNDMVLSIELKYLTSAITETFTKPDM